MDLLQFAGENLRADPRGLHLPVDINNAYIREIPTSQTDHGN